MIQVREILTSLKIAARWEDGESLESIRARLTPMQLTAPGKVVIRIQERGALPSLICARVVDPEDGNLLIFEVKQRIPEELTHEDIERFIETWSKAGWIEKVNISK